MDNEIHGEYHPVAKKESCENNRQSVVKVTTKVSSFSQKKVWLRDMSSYILRTTARASAAKECGWGDKVHVVRNTGAIVSPPETIPANQGRAGGQVAIQRILSRSSPSANYHAPLYVSKENQHCCWCFWTRRCSSLRHSAYRPNLVPQPCGYGQGTALCRHDNSHIVP